MKSPYKFKEEEVKDIEMEIPLKQEKNKPLHKAIRYRNLHKMQILLAEKININEKNIMGCSPLVYAAHQEINDEMLKLLLEYSKEIDPLSEDLEGNNVFNILAFSGKLKELKTVFKHFPEIPIDVQSTSKDTPLICAAKMGNLEVIRYLVGQGAYIQHSNAKGFTALHYAANNGHIELVKILIKEQGADVDNRDNHGCTPLQKAASWGYKDICELLIQNDCDINSQDSFGSSALHKATKRNYLSITQLLILNGANVNAVMRTPYKTFTPIHYAAINKNLDALKMLIDYGANINYPGNYSQALVDCIKVNFYDGVKELFMNKVDVDGIFENKTPLELARKMGSKDMVHLLRTASFFKNV